VQVFTLMPFVVWYVLPGLNLLTVCIVVPVVALNLPGAVGIFSIEDLLAAAILSVIIGFVMDSAKLYRWSPNYGAQKKKFHDRLGSALGIDGKDVPKIFDVVRADVRAHKDDPGAGSIELDHSRWVMINHTSKTFFLGAAVWIGIGLVHIGSDRWVRYFGLFSTRSLEWQLAFDAGLALLYFLIGWRMQRFAYDAADTSDMNYLIYVRRNADRLKEEITPFLEKGDPNPGD
jgi:hypothetical protein